jgi:PEP-CTERM motif
MARRYVVLCVLALTSCVVPARAGEVGYFFFEASDGPNPGAPGAFLLFDSPPAEPAAGWTTSNVADITDFRILDPALAPVGVYTPQLITSSISSNTGATLDDGQISGGMPPLGLILVAMDSTPGQSLLGNLVAGTSSHGDWRLAVSQAVPEPSSLALAAMAGTVGLVLSMRKRGASSSGQGKTRRGIAS